MTPYITEAELLTYCSIPGVTLKDALQASVLIDSYRGQSFLEKTYVELVKLTNKRRQGIRGKLTHYPRTSIVSITSRERHPLGGTTITTYETSSLLFDSEDEGYFEFYQDTAGAHSVFPKIIPTAITVEYAAGYKADAIPEQLKVICGLLCDNAKINGGFRSYKSRTDYDMTVSFGEEDPVLSKSIARMIDAIPLA